MRQFLHYSQLYLLRIHLLPQLLSVPQTNHNLLPLLEMLFPQHYWPDPPSAEFQWSLICPAAKLWRLSYSTLFFPSILPPCHSGIGLLQSLENQEPCQSCGVIHFFPISCPWDSKATSLFSQVFHPSTCLLTPSPLPGWLPCLLCLSSSFLFVKTQLKCHLWFPQSQFISSWDPALFPL